MLVLGRKLPEDKMFARKNGIYVGHLYDEAGEGEGEGSGTGDGESEG